VKLSKNSILAFAISATVLLMFSFAYANVPLFKLFCQRFGIGGSAKAGSKEADWEESSSTGPMSERLVHVKFMGVVSSGLPVRFGPDNSNVDARIGKPVHLEYVLTNLSADSVFFRAVHSIAPPEAAREFQLMQCFCFDDQALGPHQTIKLPVYFALSPRTPSNINEIMLSYQLFPREEGQALPVPAREAN
jgi:cytochrome c oxidase assembly protein subunit 11